MTPTMGAMPAGAGAGSCLPVITHRPGSGGTGVRSISQAILICSITSSARCPLSVPGPCLRPVSILGLSQEPPRCSLHSPHFHPPGLGVSPHMWENCCSLGWGDPGSASGQNHLSTPHSWGSQAVENRREDLGTVSAFSLNTFSLEASSTGLARLLGGLLDFLAGPLGHGY